LVRSSNIILSDNIIILFFIDGKLYDDTNELDPGGKLYDDSDELVASDDKLVSGGEGSSNIEDNIGDSPGNLVGCNIDNCINLDGCE
jgi:hypothetical protein